MLGRAALAMWWDVPCEARDELEHWHAFEHVPERLSIDGFLRASRWTDASGGDGFFVMYELSAHDVLTSQAYLARLNAPTPWSIKMMPFHRNMVRAQCRVIHSHGAVTARHVLTLRFSPIEGFSGGIMDRLGHLGKSYAHRRGVVGFRLRAAVAEFRDLPNGRQNGRNRAFNDSALNFQFCHDWPPSL